MKIRTFISADISPNKDLVDLLSELRRSNADLKVVRPELLHLTLKFMGDVEENLMDGIRDRMTGIANGAAPFSIRLSGLGAFPSVSSIRVVWIGVQDVQPLTALAEHLDLALGEMGFERDKKGFKPHLTVARARSPRGMEAIHALITEKAAVGYGTHEIDAIRLKKSVLSPSGPTYNTIAETKLSGQT